MGGTSRPAASNSTSRNPATAAASAMLLARHSRQLEYYRIACERMLRMPVERVWLYSFGMGEAYAL